MSGRASTLLRPPDETATEPHPAPGDLGRAIRTILVSPSEGFAASAARARTEAVSWVLGACGGVALVLLWLKLSTLFGLRQVTGSEYRSAYLALGALFGALVGVVAMSLWAAAARILLLRSPDVSVGRLRFVWGASAFPQVIAIVVLLPLDLLLVGTKTFSSEPLMGTGPMVWAAVSIAASVALAVWSVVLFVAGVRVCGARSPARALGSVVLAAACLGAVGFGVLAGVGGLASLLA